MALRREENMKRSVGMSALVIAISIVANQHSTRAQTPSIAGGPVDPALMEDLVGANRILAQEGVLDA
jgi:hypothetical protein